MKLVSMYGKPKMGAAPQYQFSLFSMSGNSVKNAKNDPILNVDPRDLTPAEAGIQALYAFAKAKPGATWQDLINFSKDLRLGKKWYERMGSMIGNGLADAGDKLGEWTGSAIRLATDREVVDGVSSYGAAYATGGASMGLEGMLQSMGASGPGAKGMLQNLLSSLGLSSQRNVQMASAPGSLAGMDPKILMVAGGAVLLVFLLMKK